VSDGPLVALIPCYNPGPAVVDVIKQTREQVDALLVVDDGSDAANVERLRDTGVSCLRFSANRGKGHAILAGLTRWLAEPAWQGVVLLDADGQHDPAAIPTLRQAWERRLGDLVIGARTGDWTAVGWRRRWGNRVSTCALSWRCGQTIVDSQSGFRLLARPVVERVVPSLAGGRYETESELLMRAVWAGFRIVSVPVRLIPPHPGVPSHFRTVRDSLRVAWALARRGH
jgi:glycosyltransferase involved in cell wall biosynthesis